MSALILPVVALAAVLLAYIARLLAADTVPTGRHWPSTVRRRPGEWMPVIGEARLRALVTETREMPVIEWREVPW